MRIAFYAPRASFLDLDTLGGDPIFLNNLFDSLRERGHEVKIASKLNARDLWRGRIPAYRLITEALSVRREMKRYSPDAWLIYNPSRSYPDLFGWWQRPKRYVLFAAHTWQSKRLPRRWRWLFAFAHQRSLNRADKVVAEKPDSADRLRSRRVPEERLCIIPAASKSWNEVPSREEARRRLGLPQEKSVVLCMCRFTGPNEQPKERKTEMVLDLLATLAPLPQNVTLLLIGDDGPGRKRVDTEIGRLTLQKRVRIISPAERVRLVGSMDNDDVKWFYAACDFYAYPHVLDRPWLSVMEAQACGRPVITMHTRSAELIVEPGRTGLLAKDLEEFQACMAALSSDRSRCDSMGQAARDYIAKFHSIEARARQIEEMLVGRG